MATFKFYKDSGLVQEFNPISDTIGPVSNPPEDFILYFGSTDAANKAVAKTNPGTDPIQVTIADADPGNDLETTDIKLATTNAGLAGATGGAPLDLPAEVLGGVGNQVEIHIRVSFAGGGIVRDVDVSLNLSADEVAI